MDKKEDKMAKVNHPLRARMYVGGLKSLFGDMHDTLVDVEKTGNMPNDMLQNLLDVKQAIDLTVAELKKVVVRCCEHGTPGHDKCTGECSEGDDDAEACSFECGHHSDDAFIEDDETEETLPPPSVKAKKMKVGVPEKVSKSIKGKKGAR